MLPESVIHNGTAVQYTQVLDLLYLTVYEKIEKSSYDIVSRVIIGAVRGFFNG